MRLLGNVPLGVKVGVLATISMDAVFGALSVAGGERLRTDKIGLAPVGRWAAGLARGRCLHEDMAAELPIRGEAFVGLGVHYCTGVALTLIYLEAARRAGRRPDVPTATAFGAATALLPLLIMYPCWGLGPFAVRSGEAGRLAALMLLGHSAFGAAIGIWAAVLTRESARSRAGR